MASAMKTAPRKAAIQKIPTVETATTGEVQLQAVVEIPTIHQSSECSRDRLMGLLARSGGEQACVIASCLGWKPHTLRAAISRLRREGVAIVTTKTARTGGLIYALQSNATAESDAHAAGVRK